MGYVNCTNNAQKMKLSIKDFFSKYDQIRRKLEKSLMENLIFCAVWNTLGIYGITISLWIFSKFRL